MNEKIYKGIELTAATVASIGVDYILTKAITNVVKPETIPEKIITGAGILGVNLAVDYGISQLIHSMMYPSEVSKYEQLEAQNVEALQITGEFNQIIAEKTILIENNVEKLIKQMENMTEIGGNS